MFHTIVSIKNDGHYFCRAGGNRPDGLNEPVTNDVPMTADELISLSDAAGKAMFRKGLEIHIRQREMKKAIEELSDSETILAYRVGW